MKKKIKIPIEIYKTDLHVMIGLSDDEVKRYVSRFTSGIPEDYIHMKESTDASTLLDDSGLLFIRLREGFSQSILAHEVLHCVFAIMRRCCLKLSFKSEEAYTYLMEYLIREINKKVKL